MFDIGFWEIILISIIGLVVLGPERLPIAIRSVVRWVNTARGMANTVKAEISHELKLHEMNETINKVKNKKVSDYVPELKESVDEIKQAINPTQEKSSVNENTTEQREQDINNER
jgi:sec-independent protein translocase protein TatB